MLLVVYRGSGMLKNFESGIREDKKKELEK